MKRTFTLIKLLTIYWQSHWQFAVQTSIKDPKIKNYCQKAKVGNQKLKM